MDYLSMLPDFNLSRRRMLKMGAAAGGLGLMGGLPLVRSSISAQEAIEGSDLEVGVFYLDGAYYELIKEIGDSLEADYPGTKVKYTFANTASDSDRALRWQNGNPLDVDSGRWNNQAVTTWDWVNNGFVYNMTDAVNKPLADGTLWKDTFAPAVNSFLVDSREGTTTPGAYWGVPYELVLMVLQYNQKHFETAGITTPPATWAEFLAACEALAAKGIKPICLSGSTAPYCAQWWDRLTQRIVGKQAVLDLAFGEAKATDNPGFLLAAQELAKFKANDWFMDGYDGADFTTSQALFFQGEAAMIHMGSWLSTEMADVIKDLPEEFKLGMFDFPAYDGGTGDQNSLFGTSQIYSIADPAKATSHTVNVPLAEEYLRRLTSVERANQRADILKSIPATAGANAPAGILGLDETIARGANSEMIVYYYGIHWDTNLSTAWWNPIQALFLGQTDAEGCIKMLDEDLAQYRELKASGG